MEASVEETIPELELTLDYMISLKIYIEEEYNLISDSDNNIIIELIKYLREMNVSDDNIKIAMNLLYESIDPSKKDIINNYFDTQSNSLFNTFSTIARSIVMQNSDIFTGDIINPQQIIMPNNLQNFQVILNTNLNIIIIGNSHGSLIIHGAILKLKMIINDKLQNELNSDRITIITNGSPYYLPKILLKNNNIYNIYNIDDYILKNIFTRYI